MSFTMLHGNLLYSLHKAVNYCNIIFDSSVLLCLESKVYYIMILLIDCRLIWLITLQQSLQKSLWGCFQRTLSHSTVAFSCGRWEYSKKYQKKAIRSFSFHTCTYITSSVIIDVIMDATCCLKKPVYFHVAYL